ncbi:MAG: hypothetical protein OIF34_09485, partial [Porticoccaceae bacterium]|nr:hypothetical protein [Porticoccaceae bacterium]
RPMDTQAWAGAWAVSVQVKPFVRWIWLGAILVALGALLAALDKRYRKLRQRRESPVVISPEAGDATV